MDRTTQIEELYLAFSKSQSQIDELYKKKKKNQKLNE
jgi:hypothetical protein